MLPGALNAVLRFPALSISNASQMTEAMDGKDNLYPPDVEDQLTPTGFG